ncbi:MAG: hypothetical protein ACE5HQ_12960, partial [Gemmatimonadota bacterium]
AAGAGQRTIEVITIPALGSGAPPPLPPPPTAPPANPVGPFTLQIVALRAADADVRVDWNPVPDATTYHVYAPGFNGPPMPFDVTVVHPASETTVTVARQAVDWDLKVRVTPRNAAGAGQRTIEVITIPAR